MFAEVSMLRPEHIGVLSEALYKVFIDVPLDHAHQRANLHPLARNTEEQYPADDAGVCLVLFVTLGHLNEGLHQGNQFSEGTAY